MCSSDLDYPDATAVSDVDAIGLTNVAARLNLGADVGGQPIGAPTGFHIGVSFNPGAANLDEEFRRFDYKVEAGAEYVLLHPVFDPRVFDRARARLESAGLPMIATVYPFDTVRDAAVMANEVPGVQVPDALVDRDRKSTRLNSSH